MLRGNEFKENNFWTQQRLDTTFLLMKEASIENTLAIFVFECVHIGGSDTPNSFFESKTNSWIPESSFLIARFMMMSLKGEESRPLRWDETESYIAFVNLCSQKKSPRKWK